MPVREKLATFRKTWNCIPASGWMEGVEPVGRTTLGLDQIVRTMPRDEVTTILEIGSGLGGATRELLRLFPNAHLIAIDLWPQNQHLPPEWRHLKPYIGCGDGSLLPLFLGFNADLRERITPIRDSSVKALFWLKRNGIKPDLIYIDGDHTYAGVTIDLVSSNLYFPEVCILGGPWTFTSKMAQYQGIEKSVSKAATDFAELTGRVLSCNWNTFKIDPAEDAGDDAEKVTPAFFAMDKERMGKLAVIQQSEVAPADPANPETTDSSVNTAAPPEPAPWFLHVNGGHKTCVVVFSAFAFAKYGDDAFSFKNEFMPFATETDLLFIKDQNNQWYNRKIEGLGANLNETVAAIDALLEPYETVVLFGSSMGGYAGLLFGQRLKRVHRVVVLGSQTMLKRPYPRFTPAKHSGTYVEIADNTFPDTVKVQIFLGNNELFDVYQAFGLPRQDNVELNVVMGGFHNIVGYWHERRVLNDFIATMINDPDWSAIYAPQFVHCESQRPNTEELLAEEMRADIEAAVVAFYHERFIEAIPVLEKVVERIPDWAGARSLLGQSYFAQDRLEAALEQFSLVSDHNSSVDGHFRDWVHTLLRMNKDDEARKIARRAYDTNKALAFLLRECEVDTDA